MMGNVSGVSQFLETVGVPGPQAGPESVPGQDFAAVMQKAGDDAGSPLPQPASGLATGQTDEEAGGASAASSTQTSTQVAQKTPLQAGAAQTAASAPSFRRSYVGGQAQLGGTPVSARLFNTATAASQAADALSSASAQNVTSNEAGGTISDSAAKMTSIPAGTAGSEASAPLLQGNEAPVLPAAATTAPAKGNSTAFSSLPSLPATVQKHGGNGAPAVEDALKSVAEKTDSKLTAIIPQGTASVPQSAAGLPAGDAAPAIALAMPGAAPVAGAPLPVELAANAASTSVASSAVQQLPVLAVGPAPLSSAGVAQGANGKQASGVKSSPVAAANTPVGPALTSPGGDAASAPPPSFNPFSGNAGAPQSAVIVTPTAQRPTGKAVSSNAQTAPVAASPVETPTVLNTQLTQATQQPDLSTTAPANQPNPAFQAALISNGSAEPATKPGPHVRNGLAPAKAVGDSATAVDAASSQAAPAKVAAPAVSASPASALAPAQPAANHAATATPNLKAPQKQADAAVSPSAVPTAGPLKSVPAPESTVATITVKDAPGAAAPVVSSPAAAAPAEVAAVVVAATGMPPQAPLVHGAAATSGPLVNGVPATNFGTQETGATASGSLPHTTLSTTPTSLEVGVSSGTHGWLKIRAELNEAGQVDASVTGANAAAASKLRGDLPALNSYLQGEKVQMGSLDVRSALHSTAFESGSTFSQAGSGGGANPSTGTAVSADASAAGGRGQQPQPEANSVPVRNAGRDGDEILPGRVSDAAVYGTQTELDGVAGSPSVGYGAGGGWLNVRV